MPFPFSVSLESFCLEIFVFEALIGFAAAVQHSSLVWPISPAAVVC